MDVTKSVDWIRGRRWVKNLPEAIANATDEQRMFLDSLLASSKLAVPLPKAKSVERTQRPRPGRKLAAVPDLPAAPDAPAGGVVVSTKVLAERAKLAAEFAVSRPLLPVLGGVRIEAVDGQLRLAATDLESGALLVMAATGEAFKAVVPAKLFAETVAGFTDPWTTIARDGAEVKVRNGTREIALRTLPVEDFPELLSDKATTPFATVDASSFADRLVRTASAASKDEARPVLTGIALSADPRTRLLGMVATDSYRLFTTAVTVTGAASDPPRTRVVPARVLARFARILAKHTGDVELAAGESQVTFRLGTDTLLLTRTIEGNFPNWQQLLPSEAPIVLHYDLDEMRSALKAISKFAQSGTPVRIELDPPALSAGTQDVGEARELLAKARVEGMDARDGGIRLAANPAYLLSLVEATGGAPLGIRDASKPILLAPTTSYGPVEARTDLRGLVMPVRIS